MQTTKEKKRKGKKNYGQLSPQWKKLKYLVKSLDLITPHPYIYKMSSVDAIPWSGDVTKQNEQI